MSDRILRTHVQKLTRADLAQLEINATLDAARLTGAGMDLDLETILDLVLRDATIEICRAKDKRLKNRFIATTYINNHCYQIGGRTRGKALLALAQHARALYFDRQES